MESHNAFAKTALTLLNVRLILVCPVWLAIRVEIRSISERPVKLSRRPILQMPRPDMVRDLSVSAAYVIKSVCVVHVPHRPLGTSLERATPPKGL